MTRRAIGLGIALALFLGACGTAGDEGETREERAEQRAPPEEHNELEGRGASEEEARAVGATEGTAVGAGAVTPAGAAIDPATPRFGDVYVIEDDAGEEVERFLGIEIGAVPRPVGVAMGRAVVHSGAWVMRSVDEVTPSPWARATFVGDRTCGADVTRARRVHGTLEMEDGATREATFLALSYEGCRTNAYGVVGAEVTRTELDAARLPRASAALARLVARRDAMFDGDMMDEGVSPPRAFVLASAKLAIVMAHQRWIVRDGVVVHHHYGRPVAVVTAGPIVLIELDSVSEGWIAPLEELVAFGEEE